MTLNTYYYDKLLSNNIDKCVISGPSFAKDLVDKKQIEVSIATKNYNLQKIFMDAMSSKPEQKPNPCADTMKQFLDCTNMATDLNACKPFLDHYSNCIAYQK